MNNKTKQDVVSGVIGLLTVKSEFTAGKPQVTKNRRIMRRFVKTETMKALLQEFIDRDFDVTAVTGVAEAVHWYCDDLYSLEIAKKDGYGRNIVEFHRRRVEKSATYLEGRLKFYQIKSITISDLFKGMTE